MNLTPECDISPASLFSADRLDLALKVLYLQALDGMLPLSEVRSLYRSHIYARTGGRENRKRSVRDYERRFLSLYHRIRTLGFEGVPRVPVSVPEWALLDGAHRTAIALHLGLELPIILRDTPSPRPWGAGWFRDHGFGPEVIGRLVRIWARYCPDPGVLLLWEPAHDRWASVESFLEERVRVAYRHTAELPGNLLDACVREIYAWETGPGLSSRISEKATLLSAVPQPMAGRIRVLVVQGNSLPALKRELRRVHGLEDTQGAGHDLLVHSSDDPQHARYLLDLLLPGWPLKSLLRRAALGERRDLRAWLVHAAEVLAQAGIARSDYCIVGSTPLDAEGVRPTTDVDVALHSRAGRSSNSFYPLATGVDVVTVGYPRWDWVSGQASDDILIDHHNYHFWHMGMRMAAPEVVAERKRCDARPKDLADLRLIRIREGGHSSVPWQHRIRISFYAVRGWLRVRFRVRLVPALRRAWHRALARLPLSLRDRLRPLYHGLLCWLAGVRRGS